MGSLTAHKSRLRTMPSRLRGAPKSEAERSRHRDQAQGWRGWYKTARWQRLRLKVLQRDGYTCQATGLMLFGKHPAPNSPVVDHIRPHRGDSSLFWDENNLQAVSKEYHDRVKQSIEQRGRH